MDELKALRSLATELGVHTRYTDGLGKKITVVPETLVRVCAALGAPITRVSDASRALEAHRAAKAAQRLPPVVVAWDGILPPLALTHAEIRYETGELVPAGTRSLPMGYHRIDGCTIIAAPVEAWRRPGSHRSWGVGTHLAALRSRRSRSLGDLRDLESLCRWVREQGGDLVTVLPILPTFNCDPPDPSPYSPVSRLFWSELILDLEGAHRPAGDVTALDVTRGDAEVRAALAQHPVPDTALQDGELVRYAHFRGAQKRLGRNWRNWPASARAGRLGVEHLDAEEERYHLVAQTLVRRQLHDLRERLDRDGMRLGLDLAVGVHPDGYDPWSRQELFGDGMSVGAPPDPGFPSGQDWGFSPVLPEASRREGHRYLAASIGHPAATWRSSARTTRRRSRDGSPGTISASGCGTASWPSRQPRTSGRSAPRPARPSRSASTARATRARCWPICSSGSAGRRVHSSSPGSRISGSKTRASTCPVRPRRYAPTGNVRCGDCSTRSSRTPRLTD